MEKGRSNIVRYSVLEEEFSNGARLWYQNIY